MNEFVDEQGQLDFTKLEAETSEWFVKRVKQNWKPESVVKHVINEGGVIVLYILNENEYINAAYLKEKDDMVINKLHDADFDFMGLRVIKQ